MTAAGSPSKDIAWKRATLLAPLLAIVLVYAPVRDHETVWDDGPLSFAPVYRDCDLTAIFTTPANTFEYLPVRDLTLCADHAMWGNWPGGFHLVNVAIFILACGLIGVWMRRVLASSPDEATAGKAAPLALVITLAFAMHPLQVEPVAFITARNALLALLFLACTLHAVERHAVTGRAYWYAASIVTTALALFSKATATPTFAIVALLYALLVREASWKKVALYATPHFVVTAIAVVLHTTIASSHGVLGSALSLGEVARRLPRAGFVPQFYLYKFVWPASLSSDYVLDDVRANIIAFGVGALVFAGAIGWLILRGARTRTTAAFFAAAFLMALVPVSNLLPTHPPVADRYAQIPLLFLVPLAVVLIAPFAPARALAGVAAVWIALLGVLSAKQVPIWQNEESLYSHAASVDERAVQSLDNLAYTQWFKGKEVEAIESFARYAAQVPNDGRHELFQAWHAVHQGDLESAEVLLDRAARKVVTDYLVQMVRAEIAEAKGRKRAAIRAYERAREDAQRRFQRDARARIYLHKAEQRLRALKSF